MIEVGHVRLCPRLDQLVIERQCGVQGIDQFVALGVDEPQRRFCEGGYRLGRLVLGEERGAAGEPRRKEVGIIEAHAHRHEAAVGEAGDHDAVGVDPVGVLGDEPVDERLERGDVDAPVRSAHLLDAIVHPKGRALGSQHPGGAAEIALDGILGEGGHTVTRVRALGSLPGRLARALTGSVQIDEERGLLGPGRGFGERAGEGVVRGREIRLEIPVFEADAVDRLRHLADIPAFERGAKGCAELIEDQSGQRNGAVDDGDLAHLRHRDVAIDVLGAEDAALDAFGETLLARLKCHVRARGEAVTLLIAGIRVDDADVALRGEGDAGALFLAHHDGPIAPTPRAEGAERVGRDVAGAHVMRKVEDDLGDPGAEVAQGRHGCVREGSHSCSFWIDII